MTRLYSLFPIPVMVIPASQENYDSVQLEIQTAISRITETRDSSSVSYLYKEIEGTAISKKTYSFIEDFNCICLANRIYSAIHQYVNDIGWFGPKNFKISQSWINIADKSDHHSLHCHPGYAISGCYYFRVSEEQGSIFFNNPNPLMMFGQFPQGASCPQTVDIIPDDGDIILFPSWLMHATRKNNIHDKRISIAFNVDYIGGDQIVVGLNKQSHFPYHKSEISLKRLGKI